MLIDPKWKGHTFPKHTSKVTNHQLRFFSKAIGETNPIYLDELIAQQKGYATLPAPPTFGFSLSIDTPVTFSYVLDMGLPLSNFLHGGQQFEYIQPIFAGDNITFERTITDIYEKKQGTLGFIHDELKLVNQDGVLVGKMYGTSVFVKEISTPKELPVKPQVITSRPTIIPPSSIYTKLPSYNALSIGQQIPLWVKPPVNRTNLALFAGASNDHNPIHIDIDFAKQSGYSDVFAQGMLVMAWMGQSLTNWMPPKSLLDFSARFKAITHLGDVLSCSGIITEMANHQIRLALSVKDQWGEEKLAGSAKFQFEK